MADTDDDGFITLPPGIFDTSTFKTPPKPERPRVEREEIVFVPATPGVPVPPPAPPSPPAPAQVSYDTRREPLDAEEAAILAAQAPVTAEVPIIPAAVPAPVLWRLVLPDGAEAIVRTVALIGRNPAPSDAYPGAELIAVDDTTHSVSKTHAVFEVDEQGLWVHDLNSTNGVWVVHGEDVTEAVPGRKVEVGEGSSVELGDFVLTVARR
ncbi:FHA domain-containing protein [Protaetiibacter larvae]|nr:FHA domain-containing protein [Protaetiibacter larvae]